MAFIKKQLVLRKGNENFIFRYDSGDEGNLLESMIEQAKNPNTNFDWFDAAVLSFKLSGTLIGQANQILCDNSDTQFQIK